MAPAMPTCCLRRCAPEPTRAARRVESNPHVQPSRQVLPLLHSRKWETRTAGGYAVEAIAGTGKQSSALVFAALSCARAQAESRPGAAVQSAEDTGQKCSEQEGDEDLSQLAEGQYLTFDTFSLESIIDNGATLLASSGQEYDQKQVANMTPQEQLALQHSIIKKRLGLTRYEESIGGGLQEMIVESDLVPPAAGGEGFVETKRAATDIMSDIEVRRNSSFPCLPEHARLLLKCCAAQNDMKMTAREKNLAKRQAKQVTPCSCRPVAVDAGH